VAGRCLVARKGACGHNPGNVFAHFGRFGAAGREFVRDGSWAFQPAGGERPANRPFSACCGISAGREGSRRSVARRLSRRCAGETRGSASPSRSPSLRCAPSGRSRQWPVHSLRCPRVGLVRRPRARRARCRAAEEQGPRFPASPAAARMPSHSCGAERHPAEVVSAPPFLGWRSAS
jgi:hypothetical protein